MLTTTITDNAYDVALENFDTAANALELDNDTREMIKYPERVLTVTVPVRMDDGHIHRFEALSRAAQLGARAGEGRHPLPSAGHAGRSEGAGHVDDVEMRGGEYSVRRRQGRSDLRSEAHVAGRTGADDAPLHQRDSSADWAGAGYSRARCVHQLANHGLDHGHLQHDQGVSDSRRGDRQADQPGRVAGAQRSYGPRRVLHHSVRLRAPAHAAEGRHRGGAGLWQCRLDCGAVAA